MAIPEPVDPYGLYAMVKDQSYDAIWPPDSEDVAYALAQAWYDAATLVDGAQARIRQAVDQSLAVWPDPAGAAFTANGHAAADAYIDLAAGMRHLGDRVKEYGNQIVEVKIAFWVEIAVNLALFVALLLLPGGTLMAGLLARTIGSRMSGFIAGLAGRTVLGPTPGLGAAAMRGFTELAGEVNDELIQNALLQAISMSKGIRDEFDVREFLVAGGAGLVGGVLGGVAARALNPVTGMLRAGLPPGRAADHVTTFLQAGTINAVTSPVAGHIATSVADGNLGELDNWQAYGDKIARDGLSAAIMGAGRANTVLLAGQLRPMPQSVIDLALADPDVDEAVKLAYLERIGAGPPGTAAAAAAAPPVDAPATAPAGTGPPPGQPAAPGTAPPAAAPATTGSAGPGTGVANGTPAATTGPAGVTGTEAVAPGAAGPEAAGGVSGGTAAADPGSTGVQDPGPVSRAAPVTGSPDPGSSGTPVAGRPDAAAGPGPASAGPAAAPVTPVVPAGAAAVPTTTAAAPVHTAATAAPPATAAAPSVSAGSATAATAATTTAPSATAATTTAPSATAAATAATTAATAATTTAPSATAAAPSATAGSAPGPAAAPGGRTTVPPPALNNAPTAPPAAVPPASTPSAPSSAPPTTPSARPAATAAGATTTGPAPAPGTSPEAAPGPSGPGPNATHPPVPAAVTGDAASTVTRRPHTTADPAAPTPVPADPAGGMARILNPPMQDDIGPPARRESAPARTAPASPGRSAAETGPGPGPVPVPVHTRVSGPGRRADNSHTATELPGAPAHSGAPDQAALFAALERVLQREYGQDGAQTGVDEQGRPVVVLRATPDRPRMRFRLGPTDDGVRSYREDHGTHVDVVVSDRAPRAPVRTRWLRRVITHELAEDATLRGASVSRLRARIRGTRLHPDALGPDASEAADRLSPHDVAHRAEIRLLLDDLRAARARTGGPDEAHDIEVELGLLLDHLRIGDLYAGGAAAARSRRLLDLLGLTDGERAAVEALLGDDGWRSPARRIEHMARTGEVAAVELHEGKARFARHGQSEGNTVPVRVTRQAGGPGTGFTVTAAEPESEIDGIPGRRADGTVGLVPATVVLGRRTQVAASVDAILESLAALVPPAFAPGDVAPDQAAVRRLAEATKAAEATIERGLEGTGARLLGIGVESGGNPVVHVETVRGGSVVLELRTDVLPRDEVRVEVAPGRGDARRVLIRLGDNTDDARLATVVAETVVLAAVAATSGSPTGLRRSAGLLLGRGVALGAAAAAEYAARIGAQDQLVRALAAQQLLSDQKSSRRNLSGLRGRLAGLTRPKRIIAARLFDTRSTPVDARARDYLADALDRAAAEFTTARLTGASVRDRMSAETKFGRDGNVVGYHRIVYTVDAVTGKKIPDRVIVVEIDGTRHEVRIRTAAPGRRDFAVRLKRGPGGYRLVVRSDASDAAILVETAGAMAELAVRVSRTGPSGITDAAARYAFRRAWLEAVTKVHGGATRAEQRVIQGYVRVARPGADGAIIALNLQQQAGRIAKYDIDKPLTEPLRRKPKWPAHFRRMVAQLGGAGNTLAVGPWFNRSDLSMRTSAAAGVAGNLGQGDADARLGSALARVRLILLPKWKRFDPPKDAPGPRPGDPIMKNINKRLVFAISSSGTTFVIQYLAGQGGSAALGGGIALGAAFTQSIADNRADPAVFTVEKNRADLAKFEPDSIRNVWAENIFHRLRVVYDRVKGPDAQLRSELTTLLRLVDRTILASLDEVLAKAEALHRRRSNVVEPAKKVWKATGDQESESADQAPEENYDHNHLPEARPAAGVNEIRVGWQHGAGQAASVVLANEAALGLVVANLLAQAGRGVGFGRGWSSLSAHQADDQVAVDAIWAMHHLLETKRMIKEILRSENRQKYPDIESGFFAMAKQVITGRADGRPLPESHRLQMRKHLQGLLGGATTASPFVLSMSETYGPAAWLVWGAWQTVVTGTLLIGENVNRMGMAVIKRIDAEEQLRAHADRLPFTPLEHVHDAIRMARKAAAAANRVTPTPVREKPAKAPGRAVIRSALGTGRLLARHAGLGPGDNAPGRIRFDRTDAKAINRLVGLARLLAGIESRDRKPEAIDLVALRADLRLRLEILGLLESQAGAADRWDAVVRDALRRFGVDLKEDTELPALRGAFGRLPEEVRESVAAARGASPVRYAVIDAIDVMVRRGWSTVDLQAAGGPRHLSVDASGVVRVSTGEQRLDIHVQVREPGRPAVPVVLAPRTGGPFELILDQAVLQSPERLAAALNGAVDAWLAGRLDAGVRLVLEDPLGRDGGAR